MLSKSDRVPLSTIEARILRFGPLTTTQLKQHFHVSQCSSLSDRLKDSKMLKSVHKTQQILLWYHVDGRKPEGITE